MLTALQRFADTHLRPDHGQGHADFDADADVFWTEDMMAEAAARSQPVHTAGQTAQVIALHRPAPARPVFGRRGL